MSPVCIGDPQRRALGSTPATRATRRRKTCTEGEASSRPGLGNGDNNSFTRVPDPPTPVRSRRPGLEARPSAVVSSSRQPGRPNSTSTEGRRLRMSTLSARTQHAWKRTEQQRRQRLQPRQLSVARRSRPTACREGQLCVGGECCLVSTTTCCPHRPCLLRLRCLIAPAWPWKPAPSSWKTTLAMDCT